MWGPREFYNDIFRGGGEQTYGARCAAHLAPHPGNLRRKLVAAKAPDRAARRGKARIFHFDRPRRRRSTTPRSCGYRASSSACMPFSARIKSCPVSALETGILGKDRIHEPFYVLLTVRRPLWRGRHEPSAGGAGQVRRKRPAYYGGGSIKRTGLYERVLDACAAGKSVYELSGIYARTRAPKRVRGHREFAGSIRLTSFSRWKTIDCSKAIAVEHRRRATSGKSFM